MQQNNKAFTNINTENSIYLAPINNNSEIINYEKSYNNAISLLEDPNQMTKTAFDTYIHIQNNKLNTLTQNLQNLNKNINTNIPPVVKGIKSINNSKILNVEEYPNPTARNNGMPTSYSGNRSAKYPNYLIYGNNGCLQFSPSPTNISPTATNFSAPSWSFKSCDSNNANQQFNFNQINTLAQYNKPITNSNNSRYLLNDSSNTQYGFYIVNPSSTFDQCLQLNNDGLSIMPCTMDSSQRFKQMYNYIQE